MKIHKRSNGYFYARKAVPAALREAVGKTELWLSLDTKDKELAAVRAPDAYAEINQLLTQARLKLAPKRHDSLKLKPKDHHVLADMCIAYQVELMEDADHIVDYINYIRDLTPDMKPSKKATDRLLLDFLTARKIAISPKSRTFAEVSEALLRKWDALTDVLVARGGENWSTPADAVLTADDLSPAGRSLVSNEINISGLCEEYKADEFAHETESKKATLTKRFRDIDQVTRWFIEFMGGDVAVQQVTKRHVSDFVAKLRQRPKTKKPSIKALPLEQQIIWAQENGEETVALKTIQKDVKLFQSVLSFAVHRHYIDTNPFAGALKRLDRVVSKAPAKMTGYNDDDLKKAFDSDLFRRRLHPRRTVDVDYGLSLFWVPLIAYYTGARLNEIAQLHLDDIRKDGDIWCFDISPNETDKRTKSGKARLVPIHQHLIELGFLEYVDEGRQQHTKHPTDTSHRVFPMLRPNNDGDLAAGISKALGRRLKAAGITTGTQPLHGFRHHIKTAARKMGAAEDVHDAITGHEGPSVGRRYGGIPTETADKVVQRIDRASIPVSHYRELED